MDITGENCTYDKGKVLEKYYTGDESCNAYTEKFECGGEYNNNYGDVNGCEDHLCFWSCIKCKYINSINTSKNSTKNIENITSQSNITLTNEQSKLISLAQEGKNVLVDACIGSGKTTTIQELCNVLYDKSILYLTYNKQLKFDAQSKIKNSNVIVTNYHGYANRLVRKSHLPWPSVEQLINCIIENKNKVIFEKFDLLLLDEYQDIDQEIADLLLLIKNHNPNIQIIAVGDMNQKIYDKDYLNVIQFINLFMNNYISLNFTYCFRISNDLATVLGNIWNKDIKGINNNCHVTTMTQNQVIDYLATVEPKDLLIVGQNPTEYNTSIRNEIFNQLNNKYVNKFNKKTSFITMMDGYGNEDKCKNNNVALFLTYDKCKGLERPIEVICDFNADYWTKRTNVPNAKYEIIRNIFCVAASRGKQQIIFISEDPLNILYKNMSKLISTPTDTNFYFTHFCPSDMFNYKYLVDLKSCYSLLNINPIFTYKEPINIKTEDCLIDLSPCIGIFQETYFSSYNYKKAISYYELFNRYTYPPKPLDDSLDSQVLYITALDTNIYRYVTQVSTPFISDEEKQLIYNRLSTKFNKNESSQIVKKVGFKVKDDIIPIIGKYDVMKNNIIYELKFVSTLDITHYLQLAMYLLMYNVEKGILWNTRDNSEYEVTIKDRQKFINEVIRTCTKGVYTEAKLVELPKED